MLNMSFYNGTLKRDVLKAVIETTEKPIVYTYGYAWKNPTIHRKPVTKEQALDIVKEEDLLDAKEEESCIHLNAFSSNDMW